MSKNTLVDDNKDMFAVGNAQGEYSLRQAIGIIFILQRCPLPAGTDLEVGAGSEYLFNASFTADWEKHRNCPGKSYL